ncbi:MAG TPA: DUF1684 domain-containing protein [Candidatus Acidoferrum sp.]|nr:DUF1684 domain-containing protein [Candidatus Acidoferrum sp.]
MKSQLLRSGLALLLVFIFIACVVSADSAAYRQSVEKWRHDYEAQLTSDSGWLSVSGLFWLHEGENRFGSDPLNDIVLPAAAPAQAGTFDFHAGRTTVHIHPGVTATINGKPVESAELRPDNRDDHLVLGDLTLYVHASGDRFALRLKDKHSPLLKSFTGLRWFPVDESYALSARFIPYDSPKQFDSQNVLGDPIKMDIVGYVLFSLHGQEYRLEAEANPDKTLFIVFRDLTSGKETYPASRFLDTDLPKDGPAGKTVQTVQLDFNKAYNPPCAYNPYTTCPIPLPANRLRVEIPAGEKLYKHPRAL